MPRVAIDTTASLTPVVPAPPAGKKAYITEYLLQGPGANAATAKFQNADDNSTIDVVGYGPLNGGAVRTEQNGTISGKDGIAINLVLSGTDRLIGSLTYTYR